MFARIAVSIAALTSATTVHAQTELEKGFAGALRGCEEWVLNPASWAEGPAPFLKTIDLGEQIGLVSEVEEAVLPPPALRIANHYWRINSTPAAGYVLIVSDRLPMCHISGGGANDLRPAIETVLNSPAFQDRWKFVELRVSDDMVSTTYGNVEEPDFTMVVSRAGKPDQGLDRVQLVATAIMDLGD